MFKVSASLEHACLQSPTKVLDSPRHKFLRKVIPDHLQSCATLLVCWWLTVIFVLSTRLQNCNATYVTNLIPKLVYTASRCHGFIFQQDGAPAQRACNARRHCNNFIAKHEWPPNSRDLNVLDYHVGCYAESLSQTGHVSHQQLRSFEQDWRWSGMTFLRNLWQGLSRTFVRDCKHACSRLADSLNIQYDWLYVNVLLNPFP